MRRQEIFFLPVGVFPKEVFLACFPECIRECASASSQEHARLVGRHNPVPSHEVCQSFTNVQTVRSFGQTTAASVLTAEPIFAAAFMVGNMPSSRAS